MESKTDGYYSKQYPFATKHYCQTLDLKNDAALINEYVKRHSPEAFPQVIGEGLKKIGILKMEIFLHENHAFMIVETPLDFDWERAFDKLSTLPQQQEWEEEMSVFQAVDGSHLSHEKWHLMERIFNES
ncbi:MAG: L-rhamnose mutarotase [Bacteroidales bacterium]|jgi:L-rhamnose mutarotase|nr:L-rhamnose mutarotase [Bacteroidales bacterium]